MKLFLLLTWVLVLVACSTQQRAGGSSEHENVLQAQILDSSSMPVIGARVDLRTENYLQGSDTSQNKFAMTDSKGYVRFTKLEQGAYWLEVRKESQGNFSKIVLDSSAATTIRVASLGVFYHCFGVNSQGDTLKIVGMDRSAILTAQGCAVIDSMPVSQYEVQFHLSIANATSQHGLRITIPATAAVATPIWVPLRLGASDVDYHLPGLQAMNTHGDELGVNIEEWDSTAKSAIIWVRLDSLAETGAEIILLQDSLSHSFPDAFDFSQDGWFHVWHLPRNDTSAMVNHGTQSAAGIVGEARQMVDRTQYFQVALDSSLALHGVISFWARIDSVNSNAETVLANAQGIRLVVVGSITSSHLEARLTQSSDSLVLTSTAVFGNAWHLIAFAWQASGVATLVIDGVVQDSRTFASPIGSLSDSLQVGHFLGAVDELRIGSSVSFSVDAQAFDYVVQQRHSTAIHWTTF